MTDGTAIASGAPAAFDDDRAGGPFGGTGPPWHPLLLYSAYRQLLSLLFVVMFFTGIGPSVFGQYDRELFTYTSLSYLALAIAGSLLVLRRQPDLPTQVIMQLFVDIVAITLLMHASGGLSSGLGTLLAVAIAAGGLLLAGEMALLFAALASLMLIGEQVYAQLHSLFGDTHYTQAGFHGTVFFATAIAARWLSDKLRASEAIAAQRGIDLANLAQLNDYIIRRMQSGIVVVDADKRLRLINRSAWTLLGADERAEPEDLAALSPGLEARYDAWRLNPASNIETLRSVDDDTELMPRFARLGVADESGTLIFLEDSSAIARQVQQMKQASLGRLTGSIAHEIRNPLGAISHAAQLLGEDPGIREDERRLVEIIRSHSERVNDIIENVLQLSRRSRAQPELLTLRRWVLGFRDEFCRNERVAPERLQVDVAPEETPIHFDPGQLQQILWNLCSNALRHGHQPDRPDSAQEPILLRGGLAAGIRGPFLDVIDRGPGIDEETARHIFEPFYTTDTRGSGLGLYIARALCEHNYARLDCLQPAGGGCCFRIRFADLPVPDSER